MPIKILNVLTTWITYLQQSLVHPSVKDELDRVADNNTTTGEYISAGDGLDKPLKKFFLPNTIRTWPWPRRLNQHYAEINAESSAWIKSFRVFSPKAQEGYDRCQFGLLACLTYPTASKEHARTVCDWMNTTFFIDEQTDVSDERGVCEQKSIMMDALYNPHKLRPDGEWIGGGSRSFWERAIPHAGSGCQKRFIASFDEYMESMVQEAIDRSENLVRDIRSYINMRRNTIGAKPCFALLEMGMDIPDEVLSHPAIKDMETNSIDMICLTNDMVSYNIEQARGDSHNIVAVAMHDLNTDVNGAMLWIADLHKEAELKFLEAQEALPKWGEPIDSWVRQYCDGVANWVRGNYEWSFESERYFGTKGLEIKRDRWITLKPTICMTGPREVGPLLLDSLL